MKEQQRLLLENFLNAAENIAILDSYIDNFKTSFLAKFFANYII